MLEIALARNRAGTMNNACLCTSELDLCPQGPPTQSKTIDLNSLGSMPIRGGQGSTYPTAVRAEDKVPRESA